MAGDRLQSRLGELTAVINREHFERLPFGAESPADRARWHNFRSAYHRAQTLEAVPAFPLQLDVELTSRCNFRCAFCIHGYEKVESRDLGFYRFSRVIDEASEYGLVSLKLNYINEPLLTPDFASYIRYARSRGILNTFFATNGLGLTTRMSEGLIDAGLSKVFISLDALTSETFLKVRRSKRLDKIVANIENLLDVRERLGAAHPIVRVNFLKTSVNMHEAEAFVARWDGVVDMIGFQDRVRLPGIDEDEDDDAIDLVRDLSSFRCSFPYKQLVIDAGGSILPCCTFSGREMPVGHVDTGSVKEAWDSLKIAHLRRLHKRGGWTDDPVCLACIRGAT